MRVRFSRQALPLLLCAACEPDYEGSLSAFHGTHLPVVVVATHGAKIRDEPKARASMQLFAEGVGSIEELSSGRPSFESELGIEVRGYTSQEFPKKQYGIELWDQQGEDEEASLLGLPAEADWVLHAPFSDKSLLRNHFAYELSRSLGRYAPRTAFVELFLSGAAEPSIGIQHYRGVYVLTEKVERGSARVDIEKMAADATTEPEIAGGYLLEWTQQQRIESKHRWFETPSGAALIVSYPKPEALNDTQLAWIRAYVADAEGALTENGEQYREHIEVDTFVDYFLLNELLRNHDVFTSSTYLHKGRTRKLAIGPVWDFDRALGDVEFDGNWSPHGWLVPSRGWGKPLLANAHFLEAYRARWKELRAGPLATDAMLERIDAAVRQLGDAPQRNFEKWEVLGRYVKANRAPYSDSFEEEVEKLKRWLSERARWIDEHIEDL